MIWLKTPRIEETGVARRRIWTSRDREFRVVHCRYLVGHLPDCWYAMRRD